MLLTAGPVAAPAASPPLSCQTSQQGLTNALLQVVSEKTGYPTETLELDMDMEADLGIDSIKRVEILGAIQAKNSCHCLSSARKSWANCVPSNRLWITWRRQAAVKLPLLS